MTDDPGIAALTRLIEAADKWRDSWFNEGQVIHPMDEPLVAAVDAYRAATPPVADLLRKAAAADEAARNAVMAERERLLRALDRIKPLCTDEEYAACCALVYVDWDPPTDAQMAHYRQVAIERGWAAATGGTDA